MFDSKIFYNLALILLFTKLFGTIFKKLGLPQVVGALIAGIVIGPALWGLTNNEFLTTKILVNPLNGKELAAIDVIAQIGVVMLMFSAGLETNLTEMKKNGAASVVITTLGVVVPLGLGFLVAAAFRGGFNVSGEELLEDLFFGCMLTATSVGITVETLKEMGKLSGKVGTSILGAAILDDIIGVVILAVVIGLHPGAGAGSDSFSVGGAIIGSDGAGAAFLNVFLFFIFAVGLGLCVRLLFKFLGNKFPHKRRVPIFALALCFFFAWAAEGLFSIAAITGGYIAGIMMSNINSTEYVDTKVAGSGYLIFSPVFFASIGIKADFSQFNWTIVGFAVCFALTGLVAKFIGCGIGAKACKYTNLDSARVGLGMMARGEVCLIMANTAMETGLLDKKYMPCAILLVIISSLATPILLKMTYGGRHALEPLVDMAAGDPRGRDSQEVAEAGGIINDE